MEQTTNDSSAACGQSLLTDGLASTPKFLGRPIFDEKTQTYVFADGSGRVPEEMRQDMLDAAEMRVRMENGEWSGNGMFVLGTLFAWKDRLGL